MKNKHNLFLLFLLLSYTLNAQNTERLLLGGWLFHSGSADGAERVGYDDRSWSAVTIPHDWAISGPFDKEIDKQVVAIAENGESEATEKTGRSGSLPWIGEGWYRTHFSIPEGYSHAALIFDGAMSEPMVYVDGVLVGYWAYGYNTFCLDLTPYVRPLAGEHTLAVHLQNQPESSRWYPGAGLYRPVRLVLGQDVGVEEFGLFARTTRIDSIDASGKRAARAIVTVTTPLRKPSNEGDMQGYQVRHIVCDAAGVEVARSEAAVPATFETTQVLHLVDPLLWSPEQPYLYTLYTEVWKNGVLIDRQHVRIGVRLIVYTQEGFTLNGRVRKFKGVCLHHDLGPLGAAFNKAAFRRQVRLLQAIGCDAIRTSHNMPAPWQMDICDEMGMLVMAESCDMWEHPKCKNGYAKFFAATDSVSPNADGRMWWERDFTNLVLVHRNHPSIVMWSIGNEIYEQVLPTGLPYTRAIQDLVHRLDPTRPCTQGMDKGDQAIMTGVFQAMDVPGYNYRVHRYDHAHAHSPKGILLGSETASTVSSRGVYKFPVQENYGDADGDGQVSSYDLESCIWSNLPDDDWMWQDKAPWVIGEFVWTGFDYLGEPTPYDEYWPSRSSYFGIYDLSGIPKDRAYLYRTHWAADTPTLHVLPHWTWPGREGEVTPVFCYTTYPEAELFVNGVSMGRRRHIDMNLAQYNADRIAVPTPWGETAMFPNPDAPDSVNRLNRYRMRWMDVRYMPGEIKVVAYDSVWQKAAEEVVRTAGKPHHVELIADRSHLQATPMVDGMPYDTPDLAFVTVRIVDKDGNVCPDADNELSFRVKGKSACYRAACNGDATSLEVFTAPRMHAFHGHLVVVVEATDVTGDAVLTVTGKGLKGASAVVKVEGTSKNSTFLD